MSDTVIMSRYQLEMGRALFLLESEQAEWSQATFGSDTVKGPEGPLKHLLKEVQEVLDAPNDVVEYADCLNLLMDAARRAGFSINQVIEVAYAKLQVNKERKWPEPDLHEPVEHIREEGEASAGQTPDRRG